MATGRISIQLYDDRGGGGTFLVHCNVSDAVTVTGLNAAIAAVVAALATVSTAGVKVGEFSLINSAVAGEPSGFADSNISAGAVFDFANASNPTTYGLNVPSFLDSLISPDGTIDVTATVQAAFAASMIGSGIGVTPANSQWIANSAVLAAFLSDRKRKRRLRP